MPMPRAQGAAPQSVITPVEPLTRLLAALVIHLADGSDDEVRLVKGKVFGALVGEQLLRVRGQLEPRCLRARDAVLILLLFRRQLSRRIEGVDTMVARREYAYRA